ncbi:hypothetical protein INS49_001049 [Diaporthe citri]|uniref:uncharacterized protein n=1 Tax=Diaporthe citri TaxID=83186 RepID=UPI001C7E9768|nr:uncharacterized protein INS49_001049 [Diaporthe citri]KAG6366868.1 hypothetical protein INS49_001049 [Diaporthe citri]
MASSGQQYYELYRRSREKVKARLTFKGSLDTYRFCDEVWTFLIKNVQFKMENGGQAVVADKVKIVSCNAKRPGEGQLKNRVAREQHPLLKTHPAQASGADGMSWAQRNHWIVLAVASGACASFNGVFAKLTTGDATVSFAQGIAGFFHLDSVEGFVEYIVRAVFFGLNLLFNGVMWALFTKALARGNSTTQVSIMNTSSNFFITALLGLVIFSEDLPPLWWVGATFLVAGNVIIGSKDEGGKTEGDDSSPSGQDGSHRYEVVPETVNDVGSHLKDHEDEDIIQLGDLDD